MGSRRVLEAAPARQTRPYPTSSPTITSRLVQRGIRQCTVKDRIGGKSARMIRTLVQGDRGPVGQRRRIVEALNLRICLVEAPRPVLRMSERAAGEFGRCADTQTEGVREVEQAHFTGRSWQFSVRGVPWSVLSVCRAAAGTVRRCGGAPRLQGALSRTTRHQAQGCRGRPRYPPGSWLPPSSTGRLARIRASAATCSAHPNPDLTSGADESRSNRRARRYTGSDSGGASNEALQRSTGASV